MAAAIEFRDVEYRLPNGQVLLSHLNFEVSPGETLVILGPSGTGKSTILRLINALLTPSAGEIRVQCKLLAEWNVIELRRQTGYIIQETGLFPHFTVERNVAIVPKLLGWPQPRIDETVRQMLALVGLPPDSFLRRFPHELSGGQRQRVGVARAFAGDPATVLMDEPFGALDPLTRAELQGEFHRLQEKLGKTIVLVTHDLPEALLLGTRIGLMRAGSLALFSPREFMNSVEIDVQAYIAAFRAGLEALQLRDGK
jgi:osmoprotectant transport system ATP-binding protein